MRTIPERILIARIVEILFSVFYISLWARIIFSFVPLGRDANVTLLKVRSFAYSITEPVLAPIRRVVKPVHLGGGGYLDLSMLIVIILLRPARTLLLNLIFSIGL